MMYQAELRGKLSSEAGRSEDLLTSNVFSFFKYADRETYLRALLDLVGLEVSGKDLPRAEFQFWPSFDDGTEPDVVVIVGGYYILFEAKLSSGFGQASPNRKGQLECEMVGGQREAQAYRKTFVPVILTAHSSFPYHALTEVPDGYRERTRWINWQSITALLLRILESADDTTGDLEFATDLYHLLDSKMLRSFISLNRLEDSYSYPVSGFVFLPPEVLLFRGDFIGFGKALGVVTTSEIGPDRLFFKRR